MSRYIDADALGIGKADRNAFTVPEYADGWNSAIEIIANAPTADVVEVPGGKIGEVSDGYHTFNELYHHRAVLFSVICNLMPDNAWKSKLHDTGDMYDGMFIVGINTSEGQATYHYDIDPYWDMFKVKELEKAPKWDGHTPQVAIDRISKISADVVEVRHGEWTGEADGYADGEFVYDEWYCSECNYCIGTDDADLLPKYCPGCGAKNGR